MASARGQVGRTPLAPQETRVVPRVRSCEAAVSISGPTGRGTVTGAWDALNSFGALGPDSDAYACVSYFFWLKYMKKINPHINIFEEERPVFIVLWKIVNIFI